MPSWNDSTISDANLSDRELAIRQSEQADTAAAARVYNSAVQAVSGMNTIPAAQAPAST